VQKRACFCEFVLTLKSLWMESPGLLRDQQSVLGLGFNSAEFDVAVALV
jgi:hypothetical protein